MMTRGDFCDAAKKIVTSDRNEQYGEPEDNFAVIAELWSVYLTHRRSPSCMAIALSPADVALMMTLFKIGRTVTAFESKDDTFIDAIGYLACAGEIESQLREICDGALAAVRESAEAAADIDAVADSVDEEMDMHGEDVPHVCATCAVDTDGIPCPSNANCAGCVNLTSGMCRCVLAVSDSKLRNTECPMWVPRDKEETK